MTKKHDQKYIDNLFLGMGLISLSDYKNSNSKIEVECNECNHKQKITLSKISEKIKSGKLPCQNCQKQKAKKEMENNKKNIINCEGKSFSTEEVDEILKIKKITRLCEINLSLKSIDCKCLVCNNNIKFDKRYLLRDKRGCGVCSKYDRISNEIIDEALKYRSLIRIGDFIPNQKILFKCKDCNYEFLKLPHLIIKAEQRNCPLCKASRGEKFIQSYLIENNIFFNFQLNISKLISCSKNFEIDFYIPDFNLAIEFNGEQHYKPVNFGGGPEESLKKFENQLKRDEEVKAILNKNKIDLVSIDGREFREDFTKLRSFLDELFTRLKHVKPETDIERSVKDNRHLKYVENIKKDVKVDSSVPLPSKYVDDRGVIQNLIYDSISSASLIKTKANTTRSNHKHDNYHYLYVVSGICYYYEKEEDQLTYSDPIIFKKGEMIYTPANKIHKTYFPIDTVLLSLNSSVRTHASHEAGLTRVEF